MCGIFGQVSKTKMNKRKLNKLIKHSEQGGGGSSGMSFVDDIGIVHKIPSLYFIES